MLTLMITFSAAYTYSKKLIIQYDCRYLQNDLFFIKDIAEMLIIKKIRLGDVFVG